MTGLVARGLRQVATGLLAATMLYGGVRPVLAQPAAQAVASATPDSAAAPPPAAGSGSSDELQAVIVTATRRTTTIQNTPLMINAVSGNQLVETNSTSLADTFSQIPAVSVQDQGPGQERYAIRNIVAPGEPEVGLYLDEIPIVGFTGQNTDAGSQQPDIKLWDVDRIEVLQGPQGTLYGSGSEGGTIRIISKRPSLDESSGVVSGTLSSPDTGGADTSINGTANIPIVKDELATRFTAYHDHDVGYIDEYYLNDRHANPVTTDGGRASVRFRPVDQWTMDFIAYYQKTSIGDLFNISPAFADVANNEWVAANFVRQPARDEFQAYNFISTYAFPWVTLTAIGSYQHRTLVQNQDSTVTHTFDCPTRNYPVCQPYDAVLARLQAGSLRALYNTNGVESWSSEVRLSSSRPGPLQWTVGGFYQTRANTFQLLSGLADAEGDYSGQPAVTKFARANQDTTTQRAAFGEGTYDLVDGLSLTGGVRVFDVTRSLASQALQPGGASFIVGTDYPTAYYKQTSSTGKAMLSWKANKNILFYLEAAEGFRLGGPNLPIGLTYTIPPPYKADNLWDYEYGWKTSWFDNKLTFDGAAYYMLWSSIQQEGTDVTGAYTFITNAGSARVDGLETDIVSRPVRWLRLEAGGSYTDARLTGPQPFQPLAINTVKSGDALPFVPNWTLNASGEANYLVGDFPAWSRVEASYQSGRSTAFDTVSPAYAQLPGWYLINMSTGIQFAGRYNVSLFVRNLFNRMTYVSGSYNAQTPLMIDSSPPRTVGMTVSVNF